MRSASIVLVIACLGLATVGCSGSDGDGELQPVETSVEVPDGSDYKFKLTGDVSQTVASKPGGISPPMRTPTKLEFSGPNFLMRLYAEIAEEETGTFETVQTPQLTLESTQYSSDQALRVTIEEYGGGTIGGAIKGVFDKKREDGQQEAQPISPPLTVEGSFSFSYQ
jgi:hypothetical protein